MLEILKRKIPMNKYTLILFVIVISSYDFFFAFSHLMGFIFEGSEESPVFIFYNIILFALTILVFLYHSFFKSEKYRRIDIFLIFIPVLGTIAYLISLLFLRTAPGIQTRYIYFMLWSVPAILIGILLAKKDYFKKASVFFELMMWGLSLGSLRAMIETFQTGTVQGIGGATYQDNAYIAAFAFGLNLFFVMNRSDFLSTKINRKKSYQILTMILLPFQAIAVLLSGGRGGAVLLVVYLAYALWDKRKNITVKKILTAFLIIILVSLVIWVAHFMLRDNELFIRSFNRAFAFITTEGIDWARTSERDRVYADMLVLIRRSPLFGYGIFGMWRYSSLPHNFFLEVLIQGGVAYLSVILVFLTHIFIKLYKMIKIDASFKLISILGLYPLTFLMFSGSYMSNSIFWFCISFVVSCSVRSLKHSDYLSVTNRLGEDDRYGRNSIYN